MKKFISIDKLLKIISKQKAKGKKVVLCHGVFDLLHVGHIKHFKTAKNFGDILVVSITSDKYVNKGPNRPHFNENHRVEAISSLTEVDFVILNRNTTAIPVIKKLKPNIYCKGPDYKIHSNDVSKEIKNEIKIVKKFKGKIEYTNDITFSSSKLLNKFSDIYSVKQKTTIGKIKKKYIFHKIKKLIENFKKLKILIIGEAIIDQYYFCEALGKSGKDPTLALRDLKMEQYLGGAIAISKHLSEFCNKITLLSMVGENKEFLKDIKKGLSSKVNFEYIKKNNSPTIIKKRFLDEITNNKVLGVYTINDDALNSKDEKIFNNKLKKLIPLHDLIIVSDYGHGFISKKAANIICKKSKYLAVNAQVNAANVGYHSMRKYKNIDCVIINEREMRHEMRDKNTKNEFLMKIFSQDQKIDNLIVTKGNEGSILYNKKDNKYNFCDAFAEKAVDKIGAGDAMLSIIALCLKLGFDKDLALLTASLAAAQSVETIGNKESVNKIKLLKSLNHILK